MEALAAALTPWIQGYPWLAVGLLGFGILLLAALNAVKLTEMWRFHLRKRRAQGELIHRYQRMKHT